MEWDKNREVTYQLPSWEKQTQPEEIKLIYCLFKIGLRNKENENNSFPPPSPFSQAQLYSFIPDSLAPATPGNGE